MKVSLIPIFKIHHDEKQYFGIYLCTTDSTEVEYENKKKTITIKGNMPLLEIGKKYDAELEKVIDKKRGLQYNVNPIFEHIPSTIKEEKEYLKIMLTNNQVEEIYKVYPDGDIMQLIENDLFDWTRVKGLGEKLFLKIKDKLLDNLKFQKVLVELNQFGITYKMIMKLMEKYKYTEVVLEKVKENPYILADEISGISFIKCDIYALNMGIAKESKLRINSCLKYILKDEADNNGHMWLYKKDIIKKGLELLSIDEKFIVDYIEDEDVFGYKIKLDGLWTDQNRIALEKYYECENNIYHKIKELENAECNIYIDDEKLENEIKKFEEKKKIEFTDQQKESIRMAVKYNVLVINGGGGVGKSTILEAIIVILNKYYGTCALSGKAVQRIKELGIDSATLHRLLKYKRNKGFLHNKIYKMEYQIVALDETSMVNSELIWSLIQAIKNGSKLIFLGDIEQLDPIGAGFVLRDLLDNVPTITLTKIHRQAEKSGIITVANKIRNGEVVDKKGVYGELKDFFLYPYLDKEVVYSRIIQMCQGYNKSIKDGKKNIMDLQVLVPMKNKGLCTKRLNRDLQNVFNGEEENIYKLKDKEYRVNDKIIQQGNNYEKEIYIEDDEEYYKEETETIDIYNGTIGRIIDIYEGIILINFDGVLVEYGWEDIIDIDLAYALTCHKSQGSGFKDVIFGLDYSNYMLLSRQLIYTGITRAIESCVVVCELDAWRYGIRKNRGDRKTFLREMFEKEREKELVEVVS